jgi:delta 1-pyrroline-5-carboxylate dehydrogenase
MHQFIAAWERRGLTRSQAVVIEFSDTRIPLSWLDLDFDAVAFDGTAAQAHAIAARLQSREGPLVPLILNGDDAYRYSVEQTVTTNTAAAGGDPQLLAASTGT